LVRIGFAAGIEDTSDFFPSRSWQIWPVDDLALDVFDSVARIDAELGRRLVGEFAGNLNARLGGASTTERGNAPLSVGRLVWVWLRGLFGR